MGAEEKDPNIYNEKARGRREMQIKKGSAQNSNYPGMAICPDIFQCSPQTICLKIPNVVVVRHGADGETRVRPF